VKFFVNPCLSIRHVAVKTLLYINAVEEKVAEQQDITEANGTYEGFIKLFKWGTAISVVTAAIVVLIIA
jgi:hypothetical protein